MREVKRGNVQGKPFIPSGILSLVLLPLLSLGYFYSHKGFKQYRILEFHTLGQKALGRMSPEFRPVLPQREYQLVELTGNPQADKAKLDYVQVYVRQMKVRNDTIHGIRVALKDQAKYGSMVRLIDLPDVENLKYSWTDGKAFWFFSLPDTPADGFVCGLLNCIIGEETLSPPWYGSYRERLAVLLQVPYLLLLFSVLLVVSVIQLFSYIKPDKPVRSSPLAYHYYKSN